MISLRSITAETWGNVLLAASIVVAGWQYHKTKEYELHYNTFTKLFEYTSGARVRSVLSNNDKLKRFFDHGLEIPSQIMIEIREDNSDAGIKLRDVIIDLVNYNEAICMGMVTEVLSREIMDKEISDILKEDFKVLHNWYPESEKTLKASYAFTAKCFET